MGYDLWLRTFAQHRSDIWSTTWISSLPPSHGTVLYLCSPHCTRHAPHLAPRRFGTFNPSTLPTSQPQPDPQPTLRPHNTTCASEWCIMVTDNTPSVSVAVGIIVGLIASLVQSLGLTIQRKSHILNDELPEGERKVEHRRPCVSSFPYPSRLLPNLLTSDFASP